jgi:hypothetical protein
MNIGDKVRMVRATEQGVVTRFLSGGRVEIEIEDGFRIPVLASEIVVVSPMEAERFKASETAADLREAIAPQRPSALTPGQVVANVGLYLAFVPQNDREVALHLVNNTDWELLLTVAEEREGRYRGLQSLTLKAKTQAKLLEQYQMERFEQWPTLLIQAVYFRPGVGQPARLPLVKRLKPRAPQFLKNRLNVPVLNQPGHLFLLDDDVPAQQPAAKPGNVPANVPEQLKTAMLSPTNEQPKVSVERPASVVDLHIEKLLPNGPGGKSAAELVDIQLRAFEKNLENAIATGMGEITFIHGVGSGKLRQELHRHLSRHPNVRYFEDAQKQKFGYGATKAVLK